MLEFIAGAALGGLAFGGGNTHTTKYVQTGPRRVDVHEHRAPTDDSVKLLIEMEEKARSKIVGAFVTKSNELEGAVVYMRRNIMLEHDVYIRFKLNGKDYEFVEKISDIKLSMNKIEAYKLLAEKISTTITNNLMVKCIESNNG